MLRALGVLIVMGGACLAGPYLVAPCLADMPDDGPLFVVPRTAREAARIAAVVAPTADFTKPESFEGKPGGGASVRARSTPDVFSQFSGNMAFDRQMNFNLGNALFTKAWVPAPASTMASDGLGPLFNARGCQDCHLKDGRGHVPQAGEAPVSLFLRLSVPGGPVPDGIADWIATVPEPVYGSQLQTFSTAAVPAEATMTTTYTEQPVQMNGETASLRVPVYAVTNPAYGTPQADMMLSPRLAPQMIGLGLLEAIPAADILARVDPDDADGDGISGRASIVPSAQTGKPLLGRFGLKGGAASVMDQSAAAFAGDMGLSTPLHPDPWGDCTVQETACRTAPDGQEDGIRDGLEVDQASLDLITFYARNLGVPERRGPSDPVVLQGKKLFYDIGCIGCHTPKYVTNRLKDQPEQSFQLIWPYTDLLLHDMGPGLADNRPEGRATGSEWKTPPLWGLGLSAQIAGHTDFLHDGRARNLLEAVLWHGGEAQAQRDAVVALPKPDRAALIAYLESL